MKLFKANDFIFAITCDAQVCADTANSIFEKWLLDFTDKQLVCLEGSPKIECDEHWPVGSAEPYKIVCQKCGATLLQQWRAVK